VRSPILGGRAIDVPFFFFSDGGQVKVSRAGAIAVALASTFAPAQTKLKGLDLRIQVGAEKSRPHQSNLIPGPAGDPDLTVQPDYQIVPLIRMIGEMPGARGLYYEVGGRFEGFSHLDYNREYTNELGRALWIDTRDVEVAYSYFSVGVAYMYCPKWGLGLGLGLEGRLERIESSGQMYIDDEPAGRLDGAATYLRPWGRASLDFTFNNSGRFRPFVGAAMAVPLMKRAQNNAFWAAGQRQEGRLLESIAPDRSGECYAGIRL
jgi:hypothetical protein